MQELSGGSNCRYGSSKRTIISSTPWSVTELLQSHDKIFTDEHRKWFLEMESIPGEDAMKND